VAEDEDEVEELRTEASSEAGGARERKHAAVRRELSSSLNI